MRGQPEKSSANFYLCVVFGPLWVKLSVLLLLLMREKQRLLPSQTLKRETAWKPRRKWLYDMHPHCNRDHTFRSEINFTFLQNTDCVSRATGSWHTCLSTKLHFTSLVLQMTKRLKPGTRDWWPLSHQIPQTMAWVGFKKTRSMPWPLSNVPLTVGERGLWRGHSCYLALQAAGSRQSEYKCQVPEFMEKKKDDNKMMSVFKCTCQWI